MDATRQTPAKPSKKAQRKSTKRRGRRIPQTAWPGILQQYQRGATLTKIADDFDCTPSAISYIVKKAETIYGDLTGVEHLPTPVRRTTGSIENPSQLRPVEAQAVPESPMLKDPVVRGLSDQAEMLIKAYANWRESDGASDQPEQVAMTLATQLHAMRRHLAKLEIELSKQGVSGGSTAAMPKPPRSRYAPGWSGH
ncbi:MAG: hypothetical protein KI792_06460 [Alphaproteobacteria bacterium]|nr:hypothetical protein [Alphaproteobacteria bacterium SS10]